MRQTRLRPACSEAHPSQAEFPLRLACFWEQSLSDVSINGMNFLRIDSYYQSLAKGVVIIGAVLLDMVMNKKNR